MIKRGKKKKKKRSDQNDSSVGLRIRSNVPVEKSNILSGISSFGVFQPQTSNALNDPQEHFDYFYKIIVIGDERVGKTNFLYRISENRYEIAPKITYGVEYVFKTTNLPNSN